MPRNRTIIVTLALVGLLLLTFGSVAAKGGSGDKDHARNKPAKARISWSMPRVEQAVSPGQTVAVDVTLTSSADLANVSLRVAGDLGRVVKVEPASFASLSAGMATPVRLMLTVPAQGAHSQAGVVQVRAGQRNVPMPLKVKLTVPGTTAESTSTRD